ncbi:MAG TPA: sulfotransferase [Caulobacteraceae bacterium]|nr:sulfotransferase [Caulobacteraceae bacterium]
MVLAGTQTPSLAARLQRAAGLLATDPAAAEREARAALATAPRDPRAQLILASALRRRGDAAGALAILQPLATAHPNAALTQYELGAALAATGEAAAAITVLRRAVGLNREHPQAWQALGDALFRAGAANDAEAAYAQARRALVRDASLKPAAEALCDGRLGEVERLLRPRLAARPDDPPALELLAEAVLRHGLYADAELLLARCLDLDPTRADARFAYASALFHQQKAAEALAELGRLLVDDPSNPAYRNLAAAAWALAGDFDRALATYEALLAVHERQPLIWLNYGHALRTVGRAGEAVAAFRRALALDPTATEAWLGVANLKVAAFTPDDVAAMRAVAARPDLRPESRPALHYALGKALEDAGDDAASFDHYAKGAQLRRAQTPYDAGAFTAYVDACEKLFTRTFFEARAGFGAAAIDPIFIVGLPRSGSTLIEQILASHSAVEGTMELPDVGFAARQLGWLDPHAGPLGYPASLVALEAAGAAALGDGYLAATRPQRRLGRRRFVDKMPNNFQHLALIRLMLPNATIIDARRHPMATCFSAFTQHFAQGQTFSYDLGDLGRYYRDYVRLMRSVDAALPGRVCRVIYEDLVEDTEREVRRILTACGLAFEPACLAFHANDRAVRTVSSEQVRRPIFRDGLERWRRYEPWLGPLRDALGPALEAWRD